MVLVCVIYLPLLWLAAREIGHKRYITRTARMNIGLTGAALFALGLLALWPAYHVSEDRHVLRDEIFPLNVLYNLGLSGSEFRKSFNYEKTSAGFSYEAERTAEVPGREVYVYIIGEASRAMNWQLYGYGRETNPLLSQEEGLVVPVNVEALGEMWLHHEALAQLETAPGGKLTASHSAVLSPFDPVVWDRKRAEQLFNFSYRLECYTPAPKRQYGYFVLPLLHQGKLVGRMDSKIHRKSRELEIFALWLEEGVKITRGLEQGLRRAINDFAHWQSAERILCRRLPEGLFVGQEQGWEIDAD